VAKWVYKKYRKAYSAWSSESKHTTSSYTGSWNPFLEDAYDTEPSWNASLGQYVPVGTPESRSSGWWVSNYELSAEKIYSYDMFEEENGSYGWWSDVYRRTRTETEPVYIGEVIAEDGTYPDDGWHTDGYYYKKDRLALPDINLFIDNAVKEMAGGWGKIGTSWREMDEVFTKISGVWKPTI
jgi:hypothetical protein